MSDGRERVRRPPARIFQAYFALAHVGLITALTLVLFRPALLTEFYYEPRTIAVVHMVTLGWVTGSILGSIYALGPLAWRVEMPAGRLDWGVFWLWAISVSGIATHFWINEYNGMTWAAGTTLAAILFVGARLLRRLTTAHVPAEHLLPLRLAFLNITLAGGWGIALGLRKMGLLAMPGPPLGAVYAHAHLAAVGWVLMMIMAAGYRLLPMFLPSTMPRGVSAWVPAVLLEAGVLVLAGGLTLGAERATLAGAALILLGVAGFLSRVAMMLRNRRRPPRDMPVPDLAMLTGGLAMAYLAAAAVVGLWLLRASPEQSLRIAALYGVLAIVGFLAQFVVGIGGRLLPLTVWLQEYVAADYRELGVSPHRLSDRRLQWCTLGAWAAGVPLLAAGVFRAAPLLVQCGAGFLLAAATADGLNRIVVQRRAVAQKISVSSAASR